MMMMMMKVEEEEIWELIAPLLAPQIYMRGYALLIARPMLTRS